MTPEVPEIDLKKPHKAGASEPFPSGKLTFLSPLPLPTGMPAIDHGHAVGKLNDQYLDFGVGLPPVFGWQMTLGGPFGFLWMMSLIFPIIAFALLYAVGDGWPDAVHAFWGVMEIGFWTGLCAGGVALCITLGVWSNHHSKYAKMTPTRFNRQRREVCFVPEGQPEPIFIPWEQLVAWVVEAQGVTQYGVQRQYGFGVGFYHPETGKKFSMEFQTAGLPLAISNWEAIRAYMEYEVHTLKDIQDPLDLQGPDDPPWEGVHVFRNARERMRRRRRDGEVSFIYPFFWYAYHVLTFWTLPNRLVEWEVKKIKAMGQKALPESMKRWSEPLPESKRAKPSDELVRQSEQVRAKQKANPRRSVMEVFAEMNTEQSGKGRITA